MGRAAMQAEAGGKRAAGRVRRVLVRAGVVVLLLGVVWVLHGVVLSRLLVAAVDFAARRAGFEASLGEVQARFGSPLVVRGLRFAAEDGRRSGTVLTADGVVVQFAPPWKMAGPGGRLIESVVVSGLDAAFDLRTGSGAPKVAMERLTDREKAREAGRLLWALPRRVVIDGADVAVGGDDSSFAIRGVRAVFDEAALAAMSASGIAVELGENRWDFGPQSAVTAWKQGELFLADMEVREQIRFEQLAVRLASPGGVNVDLNAEVFGGLLRGGAFFGEWRGEPGVDAAFWASGLRCDEAAAFAGIKTPVAGTLGEWRLTFRGNPARALDAEASMRLLADGVRWGERGWESLTVSASLINRRLSLSELTLRQEENTVSANAEVALSGKWRDTLDSPFLLNLSASIQDMGTLAGLLGPPFDEMTGRMSLRSSVSGRSKRLDGFLGIEASGIALRGRHVESARLDLAFKEGEARINTMEIWSGGDRLSGKGAVSIARPHAYSGEVDLEVADAGAYAWVPLRPLPVTSGGFKLRWQGDGDANFHSGAFDAVLDGLVTNKTPHGISGNFSGTYSPDNVYFGKFQLEHAGLTLTLRASLAASGMKFDDVVIVGKRGRLANGEIFLPVNPFALAKGTAPADALVADIPLYAALETAGALTIGDLCALAGQEPAASGRVRAGIKLAGKPDALAGKAFLAARGVTPRETRMMPFDADLDFDLEGGKAAVSGILTPEGLPGLRLQAHIPFGLTRDPEGNPTLSNPQGSVTASLDLPPTPLEAFAGFLPEMHHLAGTATAAITATGTPANPVLEGSVSISNASLQPTRSSPRADRIEVRARFVDGTLRFEEFTGWIGAGPFRVAGGISLQDFRNPGTDLSLEGRDLLLVRDMDARIRANVNLSARGDSTGGRVAGSVKLVDGRLFKRLEITPLLLAPPEAAGGSPPLPRVSGRVPAPFDAWTLDVRITNETPFAIVGNIASGELLPDLTLGGTLGDPVPSGRIGIKDARAYLPFTTLDVDRGSITFYRHDPWIPHLDIRGKATAMDYEIALNAYGPLPERNLILRSEPPLSQEEIILLLTAGIAPGELSGTGFGGAVAGQGALLLLRTFARHLGSNGVDPGTLLNRLQISTAPPTFPGGGTTVRGSLGLWKGLSLTTEQDESGFYNIGATYLFRFR
jgi:hypothetical protein